MAVSARLGWRGPAIRTGTKAERAGGAAMPDMPSGTFGLRAGLHAQEKVQDSVSDAEALGAIVAFFCAIQRDNGIIVSMLLAGAFGWLYVIYWIVTQ